MNLHRTARGVLGTALAVSSLAAITIITPLAGTAASAATNCSPAALPAHGTVNISFYEGMEAANWTALKAIIANFNASQSKVHVTDVNQSGGYVQTWNDYLTSVGTPSEPNVVMLDQYITQGAVDSRSIIPVATCVAGTGYSTKPYSPKTIAEETVGGKLQGLPYSVSAPILIYNKNAFAAAKIASPPATVAQMAADAALLKKHGYKDGMTIKLDPWWLQVWQGTGNSYFVNNQNGRTGRTSGAAFNDSIGKSVFSSLQGIVKAHNAITNPSTGTIAQAYANLYQIGYGYSGMTIDSSATLGTILKDLPLFPKVKLGVAAFPRITTKVTGGVEPGGNALFLPSYSNSSPAKLAAAWEFMQYLTNATNMASWDVASGYVPIRSDAAKAPAMVNFWKKYPTLKAGYTEIATGAVNNATTGPLIGNYYQVLNDIATSENNLMSNAFPSPNTVLSQASSTVTHDIQTYNSGL